MAARRRTRKNQLTHPSEFARVTEHSGPLGKGAVILQSPAESSALDGATRPHQPIFWAKFLPEGPTMLPLAAHCLDVGLVFRALCEIRGIQRSLDRGAGTLLSPQQHDRLSVLAMFHDLGKANLGFQDKVFNDDAPQAGHVRELAPLLDLAALDQTLADGFLACFPPGLGQWFGGEGSDYSYFMATFSHHGSPLFFRGEWTGIAAQSRQWWRPKGQRDPMAAVANVVDWGRSAFPAAFQEGGAGLPPGAPFQHQFAGLVTLADWIGSHQGWFPIGEVAREERMSSDHEVIPRLLRAVGLDAEPARRALPTWGLDFHSRFGMTPKPLQEAIDQLTVDEDGSWLLVAESDTGSGKTEAALDWFFKLYGAGEVDALYFALPTRVAASELFRRIRDTIQRWFPDGNGPVTVLAVPGYTPPQASHDGVSLPTTQQGRRWDDDVSARSDRMWAAQHPKRFLGASVAVGTIDQALLSTVQVRHAHLRSVLLDRSLLVVDEVHSSDAYMAGLLRHLLGHHASVGGRALLLSATLGGADRASYAAASQRRTSLVPSYAASVEAPYPALTLGNGRVIPLASPATGKEVRFDLRPWAFAPESMAGEVRAALAAGGRVLVVMNTVGRANAMLRTLEVAVGADHPSFFRCGGRVCPHHGHFAQPDRREMDAEVTRAFGRHSAPGARLLIGTQTLEQSLDIDADLLVTDLAPADVLLQRVGRLHRHDRERPPAYAAARCIVLVPPGGFETGLDARGRSVPVYRSAGFGSVYEDLRVLELTRRMLDVQPVVELPRDNRRLVEGATHPTALAALAERQWVLHGNDVDGTATAQKVAAGTVVVPRDQFFGQFEFNELGGRTATRLGLSTLQLPVDKPFVSPLGHNIRELAIPAHLAPKNPPETLSLVSQDADAVRLACGDKFYQYTRFGLEVTD